MIVKGGFKKRGINIKMSSILGITINAKNKKDAKLMINQALSGSFQKTLFTPNPEIIISARENEKTRTILNSADISIPDGVGVLIASRILGEGIEERVTGIDTGEYILSECAKNGYKIFLLGANHGVAEKAKAMLEDKYKGLTVCGVHHGYFDKAGIENDKVINKINSSDTTVLFVCFGSPMQEEWIYQNKDCFPTVRLVAALGGCLDVWSGNIKRAPRLLRLLCLEWLWRMLKEPSRIKRIPRIFKFLLAVIKKKCQIAIKHRQKQQYKYQKK